MTLRPHPILLALTLINSVQLFGSELVISPSNQFVRRGGNTEFRAALSGGEAVQFQWQFKGADLDGQTNSLLSLANVQRFQEGAYSVVAKLSNNNESLTATGQLTVCWQIDLTSVDANAISRKGFRDAEGNFFSVKPQIQMVNSWPWQAVDGFIVTKADDAGNVLWTTNYPRPQGMTILSWSAAHSSNGTTIVRIGDEPMNTLLVAVSAEGQIAWEKSYVGGTVEDPLYGCCVSHALTMDADGNIYLEGDMASDMPTVSVTTNSFQFSKLNPNGDVAWVSRPGLGQTAAGPNVLTTDAKGNVIASTTERLGFLENFSANIRTKEFDPEGNELWQATYRTSYLGGPAFSILTGPNGNSFVSIVYLYNYETPSYTTQTLEYNVKGELQRILGNWGGRDYPVVTLDQQGNFYVCVHTPAFPSALTFSKYDFDANYLFTSVEKFPEDLLPPDRTWYSQLTDLRVRANQDIEVEGTYSPDQTTSRIFIAHLAQNNAPGLPVIRTVPPNSARAAGENIAFPSKVTGTDPLTYQWFFNHQPLALETNSPMVLNDAQTNQSGIYNLLVTNSVGCAFSEDIVLKIVETIPINVRTVGQPITVVNSSGTNTFFQLDITGGDPGRSYQIESSSDLVNWTRAAWSSTTLIDGGTRYNLYVNPKALFYRTTTSLW